AEIAQDVSNLERVFAGLRATAHGEDVVIDEFSPQTPNSVERVARRIDEIRRRHGVVDVAILDYVNIMGASQREREKRHEIARIGRELCWLAKGHDVLVWTAALINRKAVYKREFHRDDIAECYELLAVIDGGVAIGGDKEMLSKNIRRLWVT